MVVYKTVRVASVLTLPFSSDTKRGLDRGGVLLMGGTCGSRLNAGEDIEFATVGGSK